VSQLDKRDEIEDPLLAEVMAELRGEAGPDIDWDGMHASIMRNAELPLARRRARGRSFGTRSFAPVAVAASIAFALWVGPGVYEEVFLAPPTLEIADNVTNVDEDVLMRALTSDLSEQELLQLVNGSPEMLLAVAISAR
jgi:hypothetical protein